MPFQKTPEGDLLIQTQSWNRRKCSSNLISCKSQGSKFFLSHQAENVLLNPLAPALDQNDQHDNRKDAGHNSNKCYIVHVNSPFLLN